MIPEVGRLKQQHLRDLRVDSESGKQVDVDERVDSSYLAFLV